MDCDVFRRCAGWEDHRRIIESSSKDQRWEWPCPIDFLWMNAIINK